MLRSAVSTPAAASAAAAAAPVLHAAARSAAAALMLPSSLSSELQRSLQTMLPLCALPAAQIAARLTPPSNSSTADAAPDAYSAAVSAAMFIAAAAPRPGMAAALQPARSFSAPLRSNGAGAGSSALSLNPGSSSSSNGAGSMHKLLAGLVWILDSSPLSSEETAKAGSAPAATTTASAAAAAFPSISPLLLPALIALDALVANSGPVRRALLEGSLPLNASGGAATGLSSLHALLFRTLARLALECLSLSEALSARIEIDLFKPVLSGVENELAQALETARRIRDRSFRLMMHLTAAPAESVSVEDKLQQQTAAGPVPPHAMIAALVNRLGTIVVAGPPKSAAATATAGQADSLFMQALALLGNLVLRVPWINSLVQSNSAAAAASSSIMSAPSNPMATSTTLSPLPLKALYRQLIACLSSAQMELVAHALRLVAHLALTESSCKLTMQPNGTTQSAAASSTAAAATRGPGKQGVMEGKLFNASNTEQTFELVFNIILQAAAGSTDSSTSGADNPSSALLLQPALEILASLTSSPVLLRALGSYSGLQSNLKAIVRLIGRRVAAASSSTATAAAVAGDAVSDSQVCLHLLRLLRSLICPRSSVAPSIALHLLVDAESLEVLLNQVAFSPDPPVAASALELLRTCNALAAEWQSTTNAPSSSSFNLAALYMPHALAEQAALPSLARMLTAQAFREAAQADELARKEQVRLAQSLRGENSMLGASTEDGSSSAHSAFLVALMHFLTPLLDDALRSAIEPHLQLHGVVADMLHQSSPNEPHNRELFALVRLMSAFRTDQSASSSQLGEAYDDAMQALLSATSSHSTEPQPTPVESLLGRSLALSAKVDRLCIEDALHFVALCSDHGGGGAGVLAQLASGLQRFNRSASRDVGAVSATLAAERLAHASLLASVADQRSSVHSSSVASADRERDLLRRLADAEAKAARIREDYESKLERQQEQYESRIERQQEQHDAELRSVHAHSDAALSELQARLEQQEALLSAQAHSHADVLSRSESDLAAALSRAGAAELAFADLGRRHQGLSKKLAEAGRSYAAQLDYAGKLQAENASLRAEAQAHLDALQAELASAQRSLSGATKEKQDLTAKLEDCWGKLVLLNRALCASQLDLQSRAQRESQQDARIKQLDAEVSRLGGEHAEAIQALRQREDELAELDAQLTGASAERDELQATIAELKTELSAVAESEQTASERCAELVSSVDELRAQIASLQSEASESSAARSAQSARLEAAEAELRQHHQLAAMIHKLSGQAAASAANGAATR